MKINQEKKLLLITSSGGHLIKTYALKNWWERFDRVWITRDDKISQHLLNKEIVREAYFPEQRNLTNFCKNFILAIKYLRLEKPDLIFSTGAGVALPFYLVAKLFSIKTIFLETFIFINQPTLTGKIIYHLKLADSFLIQNKKLLSIYPEAKFLGSIL